MSKVIAAAIMTAGRYEHTYCRSIIEQAFKAVNIPLTVGIGVYYGQNMQTMLESVADSKECNLVFTVDGDSLITTANVERIAKLVMSGRDAVAALQARRSSRELLGAAESMEGGLVKAKTAHFGLTGISVKALRRTPKPWFAHYPDENGSWGLNKIDDDINFWRQWEKAGNSLYIDPRTRIGHMEEMVAVFGPDNKVTHIYPQDWERESTN